MFSFDYCWIKKPLSKPIKCNGIPGLHRCVTIASAEDVMGIRFQAFLSTVCHFICGVTPGDTPRSWVFQSNGRDRGGEGTREGEKRGTEKTDETRAALPRGTDAE